MYLFIYKRKLLECFLSTFMAGNTTGEGQKGVDKGGKGIKNKRRWRKGQGRKGKAGERKVRDILEERTCWGQVGIRWDTGKGTLGLLTRLHSRLVNKLTSRP